MKLFLASSLDETISLLESRLNKPIKDNTVLFIANAADPLENPWWVDLDRNKFLGAGYKITEVDLRKLSHEEFVKSLENSDIVHVCGGSVFYLLSVLKREGFGEAIVKAIREDKVIYTGTSAGSVVVSKSNEIYKHDPDEVKFADRISDFSGLGLVDFVIVPHCGKSDFIEANKAVVEHMPEFPYPMIFLHDNQVVYVENKKLEILST
ncbi:MAG TPA: Type 1 glutamine amidotransferase-like domain-containing protein [Candidatus Paceibacterota bacterium]